MKYTNIASRYAEFIDHEYHCDYVTERKELHESILKNILSRVSCSRENQARSEGGVQNVILTAGALCVGKTHAIASLKDKQIIHGLVIDIDEIREILLSLDEPRQWNSPRVYQDYKQKEAGYICELLAYHALSMGCSIIVEGTLHNLDWNKRFISQMKAIRPGIHVSILHFTASLKEVLRRQTQREKQSLRQIPSSRVIESYKLNDFHYFKSLHKCVDLMVSFDATTDPPEILLPWHFNMQKFYQSMRQGYQPRSKQSPTIDPQPVSRHVHNPLTRSPVSTSFIPNQKDKLLRYRATKWDNLSNHVEVSHATQGFCESCRPHCSSSDLKLLQRILLNLEEPYLSVTEMNPCRLNRALTHIFPRLDPLNARPHWSNQCRLCVLDGLASQQTACIYSQ